MRHQLLSDMWHQVKIVTVHRPPGGAEQEVPDAWSPNPESGKNVHLHQRPRRLHEVHAATGPLHHHSHHFPATDAGRLHAASLYRPGLGLQVGHRLILPDKSGNCRVYMSHNPGWLERKQLLSLFCLFSCNKSNKSKCDLKSIRLHQNTLQHSGAFLGQRSWCFY